MSHAQSKEFGQSKISTDRGAADEHLKLVLLLVVRMLSSRAARQRVGLGRAPQDLEQMFEGG